MVKILQSSDELTVRTIKFHQVLQLWLWLLILKVLQSSDELTVRTVKFHQVLQFWLLIVEVLHSKALLDLLGEVTRWTAAKRQPVRDEVLHLCVMLEILKVKVVSIAGVYVIHDLDLASVSSVTNLDVGEDVVLLVVVVDVLHVVMDIPDVFV